MKLKEGGRSELEVNEMGRKKKEKGKSEIRG